MNFNIYYIHENGISYDDSNFNQAPGSSALWDGIDAAQVMLDTQGLGGLAWEVNIRSTAINDAQAAAGFSQLPISTLPALVFQQESTSLVIGVLQQITANNVRDVLVPLVPIQQVSDTGQIVNAEGQTIDEQRLDFPDSFNPVGLFQGPGWMWNLPNWLLYGIAAFSGIKAADKRTGITGKIVYGTIGVLAAGKAIRG